MRHPARSSIAAFAAASLLLAGCGGEESSSPNEDPTHQQTQDGSVLASTWPLTGLEAKGDEETAKTHPVLVVKIDNSSSAAPQSGLAAADLVVEELVEGGTTRLAAFFYSSIPDEVGPVRSMRASDLGIVPPGARIVTSGAASVTVKRVRKAGIRFYNENAPGFYRAGGRSAPYNLFNRLPQIARAAKIEATRPDDYLPWGTSQDLPQGQPATTAYADFGNHTTQWNYDPGSKRWTRPGSYAGDGDEFPTDTVLALTVKVGDAGYKDPSGAFVPESKFTGKGPAALFHRGRMVRGTWQKQGHQGALRLRTKQGDLTVPAGRVFIELVPADGGVRWEK